VAPAAVAWTTSKSTAKRYKLKEGAPEGAPSFVLA